MYFEKVYTVRDKDGNVVAEIRESGKVKTSGGYTVTISVEEPSDEDLRELI